MTEQQPPPQFGFNQNVVNPQSTAVDGQQGAPPVNQPPVDNSVEKHGTQVIHKCCNIIELGDLAPEYLRGERKTIHCAVCGESPVEEFTWVKSGELLTYQG